MLIAKTHYQDSSAKDILTYALASLFDKQETEPYLICIGSDHHLLDCFGPLTGTMIRQTVPNSLVYGSLEQPLHAQNLVRELKEIKRINNGKIEIAIDASVGDEEEIGFIQLRKGSLLPGRAFAKKLPPVGEYSITGVVDVRLNPGKGRINRRPGFAHVYQMAKLLNESIAECYKRKYWR